MQICKIWKSPNYESLVVPNPWDLPHPRGSSKLCRGRSTADILMESQALATPLRLHLSAPSAHVRDEEAAKPAALEPAPYAALPSLPCAANQLLITTVIFLTWLLPTPPLLSPSHTKFTLPDKSSWHVAPLNSCHEVNPKMLSIGKKCSETPYLWHEQKLLQDLATDESETQCFNNT